MDRGGHFSQFTDRPRLGSRPRPRLGLGLGSGATVDWIIQATVLITINSYCNDLFSLSYVSISSLSYVSIFSLCYVSIFSLSYVSIFSLCYVWFLVCVM